MKYKVGDRVRIKSIDWYNENKTTKGCLVCGESHINPEMICMLGKTVTISSVERNHYRIKEYPWNWTDEMIEGLVEEEIDLIPKFGEYSDNEPLDIPTMTTEFVKEHGFPCPEGYIFKDENGNVINATKIVLEKKKKEYPKTYEECCKVLGYDDRETYCVCHTAASERLFESLCRLKVCRDAYWKIAGDWKPEFGGEPYYCILVSNNKVDAKAGFNGLTNCTRNTILAFPDSEMRDAFYENFKELIEQCKELL